jgi:hypothetical protein
MEQGKNTGSSHNDGATIRKDLNPEPGGAKPGSVKLGGGSKGVSIL